MAKPPDAPKAPPLLPVTAYALVKREGAMSSLTIKLLVSLDLATVEVVSAKMGKADYRAIVTANVMADIANAPAWAVPL